LSKIFQYIKLTYLKYETWIKIVTFTYFIFDRLTFNWFAPIWNFVLPYLYPLWQKPIVDWSFLTILIAVIIQTIIIWVISKYIPIRTKSTIITPTEKTISSPELQKEEPKEKLVTSKVERFEYHTTKFVKYLNVKWHVVDDKIEKNVYCPRDGAKLLLSKTLNTLEQNNPTKYCCPMDNCHFEIILDLDSAYEKAQAAIPVIINNETRQQVKNIISTALNEKNKTIEHAGVSWEYDKATGLLNEDPLCPIDWTSLLYKNTLTKEVYSNITSVIYNLFPEPRYFTYYCPKCKNEYLKGKGKSDIELLIKEIKAIIKSEMKL
jgi:hypothetical protein